MSRPHRTVGPLASLAWRESRSTRRRLLLYMSSISLGVAALVAIDSFASNVTRSIEEQSRAVLGGDIALGARTTWSPASDSLLDSLAGAGVAVARESEFGTMALATRTGNTRLSGVRAVTRNFPLYGEILTDPPNAWQQLHDGRHTIVDQALLIALDAQVGDSLQLGYGHFAITGSIVSVPGDVSFSSTVGPRIYISHDHVAQTGLLTFGSRADYDAYLRLPPGTDADTWLEPIDARFTGLNIRTRTVSEREESLAESTEELANFLGIVGIVALLLGGVGVASGVNAWVARKIDIVAVLRCVGGTSRQVIAMFATQAALMGLLGAAIGAALGVAIQFGIPRVIGDLLPVDVEVRVEPWAIGLGMLLGLWIALAFALRPLIALRRVSPLQAIRRNVESSARRGRDWLLILVNVFIGATVVGISATRAESWQNTLWFSAGIAAVIVLLWMSAAALSRLARASLRSGWPYVVRQGVANLYRPANQTRSVVLSLGFGAFLVTTLYLVQSNLLAQIRLTEEASRGNLILFDVQSDQVDGVDSIVRASQQTLLQRVPIVTMRIAEINGRVAVAREAADSAAGLGPRAQNSTGAPDSAGGGTPASSADRARRGGPRGGGRNGPGGWALRREYRSTYRDTLFAAEKLVLGKWFGETRPGPGAPAEEVSLESSIAAELGVSVGDVITWDVQGVRIPTRVSSLREVNWARFEPNFYAVFPTATLAKAPQTFVVLADAPASAASAAIQRDVVRRFPNVAAIDLILVRKTVAEISRRASLAIRFLALFSLAMGIPVLFSAVAATRRERLREGVLLKTLGATRRQIGRILLSEYALLGLLGSLTGLVLSIGGAWAVMRWVFDRPFSPALLQAGGIALAMLALAVSIGLLSGREVFRETAMAAIREV
jgi:putative ABC transport system permease protein